MGWWGIGVMGKYKKGVLEYWNCGIKKMGEDISVAEL
jgi:hypothetical protein